MEYTVETFQDHLAEKLKKDRGRTLQEANEKDLYYAVAAIAQERLNEKWVNTREKYKQNEERQVYYISMEFLIGRLMENNLMNCGLLDICNKTLISLGKDPEKVYSQEHDAGLGNGGLGRLAACFLDSIASLRYAGHGSGIRYRYGLFEQRIIHGNQVELPDYWLKEDYPWETRRPEESLTVHFGGEVHMHHRADNVLEFSYEDTDEVRAVPYDVPVSGYHNDVVNTLRLWSAELPEQESDILAESESKYYHHLDHMHSIEQISGFLYPDDSQYEGKELRIKQQYFLVSATIQNIIREFKEKNGRDLHKLHEKAVIQINDTHPSLAVPELMRILMDNEKFSWEDAWEVTTKTIAYTNHTTLSEALEKWPVEMIKNLLPRIYMIIYEINERFCRGIWFDHPELRDKIPEVAVIADDQIHMARLAIVGSFSVNGVAQLHTEILKKKEMKPFYDLFPSKFNNKTNGITHRRWLLQVNPALSQTITEAIGPQWIRQPAKLIGLMRYSNDRPFLDDIASVKHQNKLALAELIKSRTGITINEHSIFDVQIKRLHEYKRQLLNIFHVIYLYNELKDNPSLDLTPRTFIFAAKAAPSYHMAKEVIKLIHHVASVVNHDKEINDKLKVIFLENYNVSLAEKIIPAAELSEQISTASKEASGTGNMKMMMNGAMTVGTLDGANIEIKDLVGDDNIFIFGLNSEQVLDYYANGGYNAKDIYHTDERVRRIMDQLQVGAFGSQEIEFKDIFYHMLYHNDPYFVLKDFDPYIETHELVERSYRNQEYWQKMSVANIAYSGKFSSDRTIHEYASDIWKIKPVK
ncbi:glycogen/starch/alpha-glucan phosphorylase [Alkalicoccus saliphilus]|jgi:glycogen phosphorylase|uniref:Alpha-1,4 glucan phosphorylase n=1 Tax=Alkalicoccus saliphilus TaxID=200989 RepID=A0A2T4U8U3_9BACI|nr:glycogen/starch/alpha-glucan phosphorylase [Alkalicoccus saliphilus]PTL39795.1 glycogen phosphorylase [Alkalicoccus saliphilus]